MPAHFSKDVENLIAQFRGLPQNHSQATLRPPKNISFLVDLNLKKLKLGQPRPHDQIMANWKTIVGEKNAHRSCPKTISHGTLLISVSNSTIRNELLFQRSSILKNIRSLPGCHSISNISFQAG